MSAPGINNEGKENKRKSKRNKALLASIIALALLSLLIFLGNPGWWTPDGNNEPEAEATDENGDSFDDNTVPETTNSSQAGGVVTLSNKTSDGGYGDNSTADSNHNGFSGYAISYGGNEVVQDTGFGGGGGGGGGGGRGGSGDDGSDDFNHSPSANAQQLSTNEDTPLAIQMHGSDPDGDALNFAILSGPSHGNLTGFSAVNGAVLYTPNINYNGLDNFVFQVNDGLMLSNIANVTITVNPVNDAPMAQNVTITTLEDTSVGVMLINSTSDVDGDVTSLIITQLPSNGVIAISADNHTVTYTPNENFAGSDSFLYSISDGTSNSTGSVEVIVLPVNDAPIIIDGALGSISVDEDSSTVIDIISNVFDPEGDTVTITNVTQPSHGTTTLNPDNTVTYSPDPDFNGEDSFEFTVTDGNGGSATGTVTINVSPVNDVPVSSNGAAATDEDVAFQIQLNSTDADGDLLSFTIVSNPQHGSVLMIDGVAGIVEYTPSANYFGPDSLSFQSSDGTADSNIATVSLTVNPVNDDPVANDDNFLGLEDTPMTLDVLSDDTDIEGDSLTVEDLTEEPSNGNTVINGDNTITYTPNTDFNGTDSFEYRISDGNGGMATATVTVTIGQVNDAPISQDGTAFVDEDSSVDILLNATDADGNPTDYSIISMPSHGTLEIIAPDGSMVRYTPAPNFNGEDSFTFQATDGISDSNIATVDVTVGPVNDDPTANNDNFAGQEDSAFGGNVLSNDFDIDGDSLSATLLNGSMAQHGNVVMNADGTFTYTPETDFNGIDSFQYEATDGNGGVATATVTVTTSQVNDAPVANDDSAYTTLAQPVLVKVLDNDSDVEGQTLNVGSVGSASHGTVTISSDGKGVIYTPASGYAGMDQFTYSATDGNKSDTATVTIKVYNIKFGHIQPPVGGGGDHEFEQGNTASVRLQLNDASGDDIVDAIIILKVQQLDGDNNPIGPIQNATSAGGSSDGNLFRYSTGWYQFNLKTDDMSLGKWALYVYMIDDSSVPPVEVLLEDPPIDGISTTIIIK